MFTDPTPSTCPQIRLPSSEMGGWSGNSNLVCRYGHQTSRQVNIAGSSGSTTSTRPPSLRLGYIIELNTNVRLNYFVPNLSSPSPRHPIESHKIELPVQTWTHRGTYSVQHLRASTRVPSYVAPLKSGNVLPAPDLGDVGDVGKDDGDDALAETYARGGGGAGVGDKFEGVGDGGSSSNGPPTSIPKSSIMPRGGGRSTIASRSCGYSVEW